jgi:hypothetical protein
MQRDQNQKEVIKYKLKQKQYTEQLKTKNI